jgi:hypothetical protein
MFSVTSDRTREARDVLHIVRDFPDKGDALNRQQLANLLETDGVFSFATSEATGMRSTIVALSATSFSMPSFLNSPWLTYLPLALSE